MSFFSSSVSPPPSFLDPRARCCLVLLQFLAVGSSFAVRPLFQGDACLSREHERASGDAEVDFALALTPFFGSNGLFVESEPGRGDFREVNMGVGRIFAFEHRRPAEC